MPETYLHVQDKNREISPLGREEGYGSGSCGSYQRHYVCWSVSVYFMC